MEASSGAHLNREMYQNMRNPELWGSHPLVTNAEIGVSQVFATQLLAQEIAERQLCSVRYDKDQMNFSMLAVDNMVNDEGPMGVEEYTTCRMIRDRELQREDISIRLRQDVEYNVSGIDEYGFTLLGCGDLRAWHGRYRLTSGRGETTEDWEVIEPITNEMLVALHDRMRFNFLRRRVAQKVIDIEINKQIYTDLFAAGEQKAAKNH